MCNDQLRVRHVTTFESKTFGEIKVGDMAHLYLARSRFEILLFLNILHTADPRLRGDDKGGQVSHSGKPCPRGGGDPENHVGSFVEVASAFVIPAKAGIQNV